MFKTICNPFWNQQAVADPGFPRGRANARQGTDLWFGIIFAKDCMKMKKKIDWERVPRLPRSATLPSIAGTLRPLADLSVPYLLINFQDQLSG